MAVALRALVPLDALAAHRLCASADVAPTLPPLLARTQGVAAWRARIAELPIERASLLGAFDGETLLGLAVLEGRGRARARHSAELAVAVASGARRTGLGKRLACAQLDAAVHWWGFPRVEVEALADDEASVALAASLGLEVEVRRAGAWLRDGEPADVVQFAKVAPSLGRMEASVSPAPIPPRTERFAPGAVLVRRHRAEDGEAMALLQGDPSVMEGTLNTPYQSGYAWASRLEPNEHTTAFAALLGGRLVGSAALFWGSGRTSHVAGFGIAVHPSVQGRGIGAQLTRACLDAAEARPGCRRVSLEVLVDNERARTLYEKCGFVAEGIQRAAIFRRGTYADLLVMGRVRA